MKYKITHITKYAYSEAVPVCQNVVHLAPRALPYQMCDDFQLLIHPDPYSISHRKDYFGNEVCFFSIDQPHTGLSVTATSHVSVMATPVIPPENTPAWESVSLALKSEQTPALLDAYQYIFDSPGVKVFPKLIDYAEVSFTKGRPILEAVLDLTRRIHQDLRYDPRATNVNTQIDEVFEQRHGVCQDFAHLQIGCLRILGLAARYVSGYLRTMPPPGKPRLVGADASHAWLSVYCGEKAGWVDVDPTNNVAASIDHITVAWGRDYYDVCPIQGTIVGGGEHRMTVSVDVAPETPATPPAK
ncbi:transglutaminase family protein [Gimesia panareensis]|uniref:transglutaminase family protein n=1 Tax=Gimesia panareensis TaxID=2527978 RepID=UPI001188C476|nr:transglutaminase family protein [Gimesia panareensis]QDU51672.1 Protein-glutamine gamma-glutamyltransferase [Gimesia panareensis]